MPGTLKVPGTSQGEMSIHPTDVVVYEKGSVRREAGALPVEEEVILTVNGQDLIGLMCTPTLLEELALGFLYNEGLIEGIEDVVSVRACGSRRCVDVWLQRDLEISARRTLTSGCGGGTTFEDLREARPPLESDLTVTPEQVVRLMRRLQDAAVLYRRVRGLHTSVLAEGRTSSAWRRTWAATTRWTNWRASACGREAPCGTASSSPPDGSVRRCWSRRPGWARRWWFPSPPRPPWQLNWPVSGTSPSLATRGAIVFASMRALTASGTFAERERREEKTPGLGAAARPPPNSIREKGILRRPSPAAKSLTQCTTGRGGVAPVGTLINPLTSKTSEGKDENPVGRSDCQSDLPALSGV